VLTRQTVPHLDRSNAKDAAVARGGYILAEAAGDSPDVILIGTGSEVALCVQAREKLAGHGVKARVVSLPSWDLFEKQDAAYRESVLPKAIRKRVTVEAGATLGWSRYAGDEGVIIGLVRFRGRVAPALRLYGGPRHRRRVGAARPRRGSRVRVWGGPPGPRADALVGPVSVFESAWRKSRIGGPARTRASAPRVTASSFELSLWGAPHPTM